MNGSSGDKGQVVSLDGLRCNEQGRAASDERNANNGGTLAHDRDEKHAELPNPWGHRHYEPICNVPAVIRPALLAELPRYTV
jgi:hypothetical protein